VPVSAAAAGTANDVTARGVALDLVDAVLRRKQALGEVLARHPGMAALDARDRAFARLMVATVLRRLPQIDALIDRCLDKDIPERAGIVRDLLRLGAAQLLFIGTPAHAAVDETVALVGKTGHPRLKGLANAVLRRLAREGTGWAAEQDAERLNTPEWMWASWSANYSEEVTREIAAAHLADPPLDLTVRDDRADWAMRLEAEVLPTGSLRRPQIGTVTALPGYAEGAWWVQDAAAALPARLLGDLAGRRVADLCAAPGGKTAQLVAAGAEVVAVDRSAPRMALLQSNLARLGLEAESVLADAVRWRPARPLDAVLVDAPCSATGTARRHPDILRLKTPADVAKLARLQDRLLAAAAEMLAPGGRLVFCSCSLEAAEGPERIAALLAGGAPFARDPIRPGEIAGAEDFVTADGDLRTLPSHWADRGGLDGFYAARLVRR
jgi:16S rRNA (cytosine967-C5)-methyltransferase